MLYCWICFTGSLLHSRRAGSHAAGKPPALSWRGDGLRFTPLAANESNLSRLELEPPGDVRVNCGDAPSSVDIDAVERLEPAPLDEEPPVSRISGVISITGPDVSVCVP